GGGPGTRHANASAGRPPARSDGRSAAPSGKQSPLFAPHAGRLPARAALPDRTGRTRQAAARQARQRPHPPIRRAAACAGPRPAQPGAHAGGSARLLPMVGADDRPGRQPGGRGARAQGAARPAQGPVGGTDPGLAGSPCGQGRHRAGRPA
ncbi:hypothetical protein OY671_012476, partial [Metschnikowia pulcherrima]